MRKRKNLAVTGLIGILLVGVLVVIMIGTPLGGNISNAVTGHTAPTEQGHTGSTSSTMLAKNIKPAPIPGSYIVVLKEIPNSSPGKITTVAHDLATRYHGRLTHIYTAALHGFSLHIAKAQEQMLARDALVASVEQDMTAPPLSTSMPASTTQPSVTQATSISTQLNAPWDLDRLDQSNLPLSGTYTYDTTASNVSVYVLDTGIRLTHTEFGGRAFSVPNGVDNNDCAGHGTMVAGAIGGTTWGVAKNVKLYSLRVLNCQNTPAASDGLAGVDWVTANAQRPAVVNISWRTGIEGDLDTAITNSIQSGITYAIAAGNSNTDACGGSPQDVSQAIVVGSSGSSDARSSFSNYGKCVTLFAPGENIPTSSFASDTATTAAGGTSLSAPLVAGAAALYLSTHPSATSAQVKAALVACAISGIIPNPGIGSPNKLLNTQCDQPIKITNPGELLSPVGQATHLQIQSTDPNAGRTVTYSVQNLPSGLSLNAATGVISGTFNGKGESTVLLSAHDSTGATGTASFLWFATKGYGLITDSNANCLDDRAASVSDGNPIQVYNCNQTPAQQWVMNADGTINVFNRCMTASGGATTDGTPIVLSNCSATPSQIWQPQANGTILNPTSGLCLNEPNANTGIQLTLATCTTATTQQWKVPNVNSPNILSMASPGNQFMDKGTTVNMPLRAFDSGVGQTITYSATGLPFGLSIDATTGTISGTLMTEGTNNVTVTARDSTGANSEASFNWQLADGPLVGLSGQCADDTYIRTNNGNPIQVIGCYQVSAQQWTLGPNNTLEVVGKCLTTSGTANGAAIVIYDCSTAPSQVWQPQTNGTLLNPASGRCLNAPSTNSLLTLADCTATANQRWTLPFSDSVVVTNPGNLSSIISATTHLPIKAGSFNPQQTLSYSATGLPAGLSINAATGLITGTPTAGGTSNTIVIAKDSGGAVGAASFSWAIVKGYGTITDSNGNCLDDSNYGTSDGNPIQIWRCNQSSAQFWIVNTDNTISVFGKCLTASGGGTASGTPIVLSACSAAPAQIWQSQANGTVLNPTSGLCLNEPSASTGTKLTLATCTTATTQQWKVPNINSPNILNMSNPGNQLTDRGNVASLPLNVSDSGVGQVITYSATGLPTGLAIDATTGIISGTASATGTSNVTVTAKDSTGVSVVVSFRWQIADGPITDSNANCLDDSNYGTSNGNPIQIWSCNQSSAQQWTLSPANTLQVLGKCLTTSGTANGAAIVLSDCSTASTQVWQPQTNKTLLNPASGFCLNEPAASTGTQLTLATCTTATTQQWTLPVSDSVMVTNPGNQSGAVGTAASLQIQAASFEQQQTLSYSATGLPKGLSINAATGLITGTPTAGGSSNVTVTAKDSGGAIGAISFSWAIVKGQGVITDSNANCLDDSNYGTSNGNTIQIWKCNQATAQQWIVNIDNTIGVFGKCMTASGGGTANGTLIVLYDCSTAPSQVWQYQANGTLLNPVSGLCLNEPSATIGTPLTLATCTGVPTQQWFVPGTTAPNTVKVTNPGNQATVINAAVSLQVQAIDSNTQQTLSYSATGLPKGLSINAATGLISGTLTTGGNSAVTVTVKDSTKVAGVASFNWAIIKGQGVITDSNANCLDDSNYGTSNGNTIQIWKCNQATAQQWTLNADNTIGVFGKCMTASGGGTANGTLIVLYDCSTAPSQIWQPQANGTLLNPSSGLCLNEPSATIGTQLTLATCTTATTQQWTLPTHSSVAATSQDVRSSIRVA